MKTLMLSKFLVLKLKPVEKMLLFQILDPFQSLQELTTPILTGNSRQIQQQAIHRLKKCTPLKNSDSFNQVQGIFFAANWYLAEA